MLVSRVSLTTSSQLASVTTGDTATEHNQGNNLPWKFGKTNMQSISIIPRRRGSCSPKRFFLRTACFLNYLRWEHHVYCTLQMPAAWWGTERPFCADHWPSLSRQELKNVPTLGKMLHQSRSFFTQRSNPSGEHRKLCPAHRKVLLKTGPIQLQLLN